MVGDAALLVPAKDALAIRKALERLLRDAALCQRMGEAARSRLEQRFAWTAIADQHMALYDQAVRR